MCRINEPAPKIVEIGVRLQRQLQQNPVRVAIRDFLWNVASGLPVACYSDDEVAQRTEEVYRHVFRVYPTVPLPYYTRAAA